jgi:pimeloyl-ACP methyl ester carboxylesterase
MTAEMTAAIEQVSSGGIAVARAGTGARGRPLVLLHGIGSNAHSYARMMSILAPDRMVIAWDAPGYGASEPLALDWPDASDYAAALDALLDRLGVATFDLMGHSLGSLVAGRYAASNPHRVHRLILASPALGYGTRPGDPLAPAAANRLQAFLDEGGERFAATRGPRLVHARDDVGLVAGVVNAMSEIKLPGYRQASRMLSTGSLLADCVRIATPTLVLVGAEDEITPPANCRRAYDALTAARPQLAHRFELVPAAGHAVPLEKPADVARLVSEFAPAVGD